MKTLFSLPSFKSAAVLAALIPSVLLRPAPAEAAAVTFTNLHSFSVFPNGADPQAAVVQGSDGSFYGTTSGGGTNGGNGVVFKVTTNGVATALYEFTNGSDGAVSTIGLALGSDGNFYGTTSYGGTNGAGSVFNITTNGVLTNLYSFTGGVDGLAPQAGLVQGSDGSFYGTTQLGGTNHQGNVFQVTTNGVLRVLHSFAGYPDGANPEAALVQGSDGSFYGTTDYGGTNNRGGIFKITTNGTLTELYSFNGGTNGAFPRIALVQGLDGSLYGTTPNGGNDGNGAVFKVTTNGVLTNLYSFTNGIDGASPTAALMQDSAGNLYGTTSAGGLSYSQNGYGTVFKITTNGAFTPLYAFTGNADGAYPQAALVLGVDGNLYGTASYGGVGYSYGGNGTVFKMALNGKLATVYAFPGVDDGRTPSALVFGHGGSLYGTTQYGGANGANGNVFSVTTSGALDSLYSFAGSYDGETPEAALVQGSDGNFYGTTSYLGSNYDGTVFEISPGGTLTTLYTFTGNYDGSSPNSALVEGSDGTFYGTTAYGGNGYGVVFSVSTNGTLTTLYAFYGQGDGVTPNGVVLGSDGNLYGTTQYNAYGFDGFSYSYTGSGTVFSVSTDGNFNSIYDFTNGVDGALPTTALAQGVDGNFYGTTSQGGGTNGDGIVFEVTPNGSLTEIYTFTNGVDGYSPSALLAGANGLFYGTTTGGGTNYDGNVFQVTTNGVLVNLYSFFGGFADGGYPQTSLAQGADGSLYGTTTSGGAGGSGGVFRVSATNLPSPLPMITAQPASVSNILAGLSAKFKVAAIGAGPLGYQWQLNGIALPTDAEFSGTTLPALRVDPAFPTDAGSYSVIVYNVYGAVTSAVASLSLYVPTNSTQAYTDGTNYLGEADLVSANLSFASAISLNTSTNADANSANYFLLAATELLSVPSEPAGSNFLNHLGLSDSGRDVFKWKAKLASEFPLGVNADEITAQLRTNVLSAIIAAQADLAAITNTNFTLALTTNETHAGAVTVDYGDVQVLRSFCDTAELLIYTLNSVNLDVQLTTVSNYLGTDKAFGTLLADYPSLLTTATTSDLPAASNAFSIGANQYLAASEIVRSRPTNEMFLFNLTGSNELHKELEFRETLTNLLTSLTNGGTPVTLTSSTNLAVSMAAFFSGSFDVRAVLPEFQGNEFVWNSITNTTFGGLIEGLTQKQLSKAFLKHFNTILDVPGVSVSVLYNFPEFLNQNGVVQAPDGNLYGTTQDGPYTYTTNTAYYTNSYQAYYTNTFPGTNGFVITNITPNFFAYTNIEQNPSYGSVFKITPSGQYSTLYTFGTVQLTNITGPYTGYEYIYDPALGYDVYTNYLYYQTNYYQLDGSAPNALVLGEDGDLYGTTQSGGLSYYTNYNGTNITGITTNYYDGTVFKVTPSGQLTTLYDFGTAVDQYANAPVAALVQGADGRFYGTTQQGGQNGSGTVFAVATNGVFSPLYSFNGSSDGTSPTTPLVQGVDGDLYGTTPYGGIYTNITISKNGSRTNTPTGYGTIYKVTTSGQLSVLYTFGTEHDAFGDSLDGNTPGGLVQGADTNFYGTTEYGGTNYDGSAFKISPSGVFSNLLTFNQGNLEGYLPFGSLVPSANGAFYGVTSAGGANNSGSLFLLNSNPAPTNVTWFGKASGGYLNNYYSYGYNYYDETMPAPLVLGADGNYYGTTTDDGSYGSGTVYRLTISSPPAISLQPASQTAEAGSTVFFEVSASGTPSPTYSWLLNGKPLFNAGNVSGAQGNVLTLTDISAGNEGSYSVIVSNSLGTATSESASLVVLLPPSITKEPLNQLTNSGDFATFAVEAGGTPPLSYQWFLDSTNAVAGATTNFVAVTNAGSYTVVVTNLYGSVTSSVATLTTKLTTSVAHPSVTVSITSPAAGGRTTNGVTGKAIDDTKLPIWNVFYTLTNINHTTNITSGQAVLSSGTNWSVMNISPGTNIIAIYALDLGGNRSATVTRKFFSDTGAPLTLLTQGTGSGNFTLKSFVSTEKNLTTNSLLNIGEEYEITEKPSAHSLFGGWVVTTTNSSLSTNLAAITFVMESSLRITASFETNIFLAGAGAYNGLFAVVNSSNNAVEVSEQTAGLLGGLTVGTNGAYSGKLWIDGVGKSVSGTMNAYGNATNKVALAEGAVLLEMTMDTSTNPPFIYGTVSGSNGTAWTSMLMAFRAANTLRAADYTMLIPGGITNSPGGYGYALITNTAGTAKTVSTASISGALADGTTFSQTVGVSDDGYVPLYDSLYGNKGLVLGWINLLTNADGSDLTWIHPATTSGLYKSGFTNIIGAGQIELSPWLDTREALATLTNSLTNFFISDTINSADVTNFGVDYSKTYTLKEFGPGFLSGSLNPKTGLLKVTFGSKSSKTTNGFGAILQNTTNGGGYFLTPAAGEAIQLQP